MITLTNELATSPMVQCASSKATIYGFAVTRSEPRGETPVGPRHDKLCKGRRRPPSGTRILTGSGARRGKQVTAVASFVSYGTFKGPYRVLRGLFGGNSLVVILKEVRTSVARGGKCGGGGICIGIDRVSFKWENNLVFLPHYPFCRGGDEDGLVYRNKRVGLGSGGDESKCYLGCYYGRFGRYDVFETVSV